ncbi:MAG TPA: folylpolyglutamate synthase/dihydrofolate synthase family protein [Thermoanaerobaculia bacterium]|nr:folylpolyglutamate synthase/dihydrofolate synthase family protein [Thermoanaerobaculia bacterium]
MPSGLAWLDALGPQRIRPGLAKTRALLACLARPETSFRSILVGGTNGKGSTAAATASILREAGVRAGLYTSPHLVRVNERIRVDGADVSDAELDDVLSLLAAISPAGERAPTYFEAITVAAFELFRRARVTAAVVEVGLGGRLDATNVLQPEVSVVTNVGLDHVAVLGPTLADIAREKAGIFRSGQPALTAAEGEPLDVLHAEARRVGARLIEVPASERFDDVSPLPGVHQRKNLALAAAAAGALVPLSFDVVRAGVAATRWPGRLQSVRREGRELLLDGAHNPDGARALAAHLDASGLAGRVDLVFGGLSDKALEEMFAVLSPRVRRVLVVAPDSPRAVPAGELARRLGLEGAAAAADLAAAIARLDASAEREGPILVTGSLVLVGDALRLCAA